MAQIRLRSPGGRSEDGAELVEFALVLPMLLLVVLGIAEFGFIFQRYEVVTNAAREGARMACSPATRPLTCGLASRPTSPRAGFRPRGRIPSSSSRMFPSPRHRAGPALTAKRVTVTYRTHTCS